MTRGRGGVACWGMEGRRAARWASKPCWGSIAFLPRLSHLAARWQLPYQFESHHQYKPGLGSSSSPPCPRTPVQQVWAHWEQLRGAGRSEPPAGIAGVPAPGSPSREALPGGEKLAGPLLAAVAAPGRVCAGFLSSSALPGRAAGSHRWGSVAAELLGFSCQLGGGSAG